MREIKCKNCGSASFRREGDYWICEHCGSRYLSEDKFAQEIKYYVMKAEEAFDNGKYEKMNDCAMRILSIDPEHSYAWLMRMYYFGFKAETYYTDDLIEAGKNAVRFEKEDLQDTELRVYKAFIDWGKSGALNANSHISVFQKKVKESPEWKHPEEMDAQKKIEEYRNWPASAASQLEAAVSALREVPQGFLHLGIQKAEKDSSLNEEKPGSYQIVDCWEQFISALEICECALDRIHDSYIAAGFDKEYSDDYEKYEIPMNDLWEKAGGKRPSPEMIHKKKEDQDKDDKEREEKFRKKDRRNYYDYSLVKSRFLDINEIKDKKWKDLISDYEPWITLEYWDNAWKCSYEQRKEWKDAIDICHQELLRRISLFRRLFALITIIMAVLTFSIIRYSLSMFVFCLCFTFFDILVYRSYCYAGKRILKNSEEIH